MKKLLFFAFAFMLHISLSAQSSSSELAQQMTQTLTKVADLTANQQTQVLNINETKFAEIEAIRDNNDNAAVTALKNERYQEILDVLTPAQRNKAIAARQRRGQERVRF